MMIYTTATTTKTVATTTTTTTDTIIAAAMALLSPPRPHSTTNTTKGVNGKSVVSGHYDWRYWPMNSCNNHVKQTTHILFRACS